MCHYVKRNPGRTLALPIPHESSDFATVIHWRIATRQHERDNHPQQGVKQTMTIQRSENYLRFALIMRYFDGHGLAG